MSSGTIYLAIIVLAPIIGLYLLSVNAGSIYLGLALGFVLYSFDSHNATSLVNSISKQPAHLHLKPTALAIDLLLLVGPALLILLFQIKSVSGSKKILNILPSVFCGLFIALMVVPILPNSVGSSIIHTKPWTQLVHYQAAAVGAGALISIVFFWLTHHGANQHRHNKSKL